LKSFLESVEFTLQPSFLDRDDFGWIQSKIMHAIDPGRLEPGGKLGGTFSDRACERGFA
jgi:hypothetical protein